MTDATSEAKGEVARALAQGNPADAALLSMRFLHGLSYVELAAVLDVAEATARVRVHRAIERLRRRIRRNDLDEETAAVLLASLPPPAPSPLAVEGAIAAALGAAGGVAPAVETVAASSTGPVLAVAGVLLLAAAGVGLFAWLAFPTRSGTPSTLGAASFAAGRTFGPRLQGRGKDAPAALPESETPVADATLADALPRGVPGKLPPAPVRAPGGGHAAPHPVGFPLRARLLLVHGDGKEETLPLARVEAFPAVALAEEQGGHADAARVFPGQSVTLDTDDPRATFHRIRAVVPASGEGVVIRIPEKGAATRRDLTLEVVDAVSGLPLADAWLEWGVGEGPAARARADRQGRIPVHIPPGASEVAVDDPILARFEGAAWSLHAPGHLPAGQPWCLSGSHPVVSVGDLASWTTRGGRRIALSPTKVSFAERPVRILRSDGRPLAGAVVVVMQPVLSAFPGLVFRRAELRRADNLGHVSLPVHRVVGLEIRVEGVPVAAWGLAACRWPETGPRLLHLPPLARAELVLEDVPEGGGSWRLDPLGAKRTPWDPPLLSPVLDAEARALLDSKAAMLGSVPACRAGGRFATPRAVLRFFLPVGHAVTLYLQAGGTRRTWTVRADAAGPFHEVRSWESLPRVR